MKIETMEKATIGSYALHLATIAMFALLASCGTLRAPVQSAETPEQKLAAVYASYVILKEEVADVVESGTVPDEYIVEVAGVEKSVSEVFDKGYATLEELLSVRAEILQVNNPDEVGELQARSMILAEKLPYWIAKMGPELQRFARTADRGER